VPAALFSLVRSAKIANRPTGCLRTALRATPSPSASLFAQEVGCSENAYVSLKPQPHDPARFSIPGWPTGQINVAFVSPTSPRAQSRPLRSKPRIPVSVHAGGSLDVMAQWGGKRLVTPDRQKTRWFLDREGIWGRNFGRGLFAERAGPRPAIVSPGAAPLDCRLLVDGCNDRYPCQPCIRVFGVVSPNRSPR
jgi:hypothetical protein